jgi:hypothetical protein
LESLKVGDHLDDLGAGGKIILELIFGKWAGKVWIGFIRLGIGTSGGIL